ncbi:hypothetical protein DSECCO2_362870 [anaerobic digester metagenome]
MPAEYICLFSYLLHTYFIVSSQCIFNEFKRQRSVSFCDISWGSSVHPETSDVLSNLPMLDQCGLELCINLGASHPLYEQNKYVVDTLKHIVKKYNIGSLLEYSETSERLKQKQSGQLWFSQFGLNVPEEQVLITSGLQNSLAIILTSLFRFGDKIVTNSIIYPGIKNIANSL